MRAFFDRTNRFLEHGLDLPSRLFLLVATGLVVVTYVVPLWNLTMFAPQYPEGLRLDIYSWTLDGGNNGQDVREINVLNHYIGMRDITVADFTEFKWMPFVIGALGLLFLRATVHGSVAGLVDVTVLFTYFGAFSLWSFAHKLYLYGHDLAPTAAVKVEPFMPPIFGFRQIANFEVYSYPRFGTYAMVGVALCLFLSLVLAWRDYRRSSQG